MYWQSPCVSANEVLTPGPTHGSAARLLPPRSPSKARSVPGSTPRPPFPSPGWPVERRTAASQCPVLFDGGVNPGAGASQIVRHRSCRAVPGQLPEPLAGVEGSLRVAPPWFRHGPGVDPGKAPLLPLPQRHAPMNGGPAYSCSVTGRPQHDDHGDAKVGGHANGDAGAGQHYGRGRSRCPSDARQPVVRPTFRARLKVTRLRLLLLLRRLTVRRLQSRRYSPPLAVRRLLSAAYWSCRPIGGSSRHRAQAE